MIIHKRYFQDCGEVIDVIFNTDCKGGFTRFGYVKFLTTKLAEKYVSAEYVVFASILSSLNFYGVKVLVKGSIFMEPCSFFVMKIY